MARATFMSKVGFEPWRWDAYYSVMRFRTYKNTDLKVSEVGFGLWTVSTGWWGQFTDAEAIALMHKAFDLGITLFDAADTLMCDDYLGSGCRRSPRTTIRQITTNTPTVKSK